MKVITYYECDICRTQYHKAEHAQKCEAAGYGTEYPVGLMYGNHTQSEHLYYDITFAVASNHLHSHTNWGYSWACRDNGYSDSLDESICTSGNELKLTEHHGHLNPNHPTFKRMVNYLIDHKYPLNDHEIQVWNGKEPIPLAQYIEEWNQRHNLRSNI